MKFQVGYQNERRFIDYLLKHRENISELYFPWGDFTTGRGIVGSTQQQRQLEDDLAKFSRAGIGLCLLLNGNCYGRSALARAFFQKLGDTVDFLRQEYKISSVTAASPVIARFIKRNFPEIEVRASVNMEIGTPEGVEYIEEYFDSFYLKREFNYNQSALLRMKNFCHSRGKKMLILANSGCLNFCSARTFHDNLVAHQHETGEMDNAFIFHGACSTYLEKEPNRMALLAKSNFIRPEDVAFYEELCDGMKLATRTNFNPLAVATAYFSGKWEGNLLDLTEPAHSEKFLPRIISNKKIPADYFARRMNCSKVCENCSYCRDVLSGAVVNIEESKTIIYKQ